MGSRSPVAAARRMCAATCVLLVRALSSGLRDSHVSSKTVCRHFRVSGVGTSIFHLLLIAGCEPLPSTVRLRDSHFVVGFPRTLIKPSHSCRDRSSGNERWQILRHGANKTG